MSITLDGNNANTVGVINSATAKTATGTAVDFTGIPAGVKRITVMFQGVSTNGSSAYQIRLGASGGIVASGYSCGASGNGVALNSSTGFLVSAENAASIILSGALTISNISGNAWVSYGSMGRTEATNAYTSGGSVSLSGTLDRIRITTVNGTDTFDAGSINILYE